MPQIDLAQATIRLKDGYSAVGALNDVAGADALDTAITVDGFTAAIPAGVELRIAGHPTTYTVVSTVGGATPTSITITPALTASVADNAVITVGPRFVEVVVGEGNLTYDEKQSFEYTRNKRKIHSVRTGDEQPMDVSLDALWEYLTSYSTEPATLEEALKKEGAASSWASSGADPCEPYCVDIEIVYTPPCIEVGKRERITLKEFRHESLAHDLKAGTIATKGMCKIPRAVIQRF
jgi:hypothetical protein